MTPKNSFIFLCRCVAGVLSFIALILCFLPATEADQKNRLIDIRYWSAPTFTRIVFDLKQKTSYESSKLTNPERITLTMEGFDGFLPKDLLSVGDGIVRNVRVLQDRQGTVRVVIELEKPATHNIFPLGPIDGKSPRLVVDITREDLEMADRRQREETRRLKKKGDIIVVVDPGHGGEDPGAVSKRGVQEKDVVFAISKRLVAQLQQIPGIRAYLTRQGDYFIPLQKRIKIAKEYGADIFVSIHVNAGFSPRVTGSSVYCLSFKGASSNAAQLAANRENASDSIGGVPFDQQQGVNAILYDMVQTHTLNTSMRFAEVLLSELSKINKLHTQTPQQANFAVLRSLDIPSVLIETDFISNPEREQALLSPHFQNDIAKAIAGTIRQYTGHATLAHAGSELSARALIEPLPASSQRVPSATGTEEKKTIAGTVEPEKGPSSKKTPVARKSSPESETIPGYRIVKKSSTHYALVPARGGKRVAETSVGASTPRFGKTSGGSISSSHSGTAVHVVKKGETFFSIARMYDISVAELKKLNGMSEMPELKIGERIRVPALSLKAPTDTDKNS